MNIMTQICEQTNFYTLEDAMKHRAATGSSLNAKWIIYILHTYINAFCITPLNNREYMKKHTSYGQGFCAFYITSLNIKNTSRSIHRRDKK